MARQDDNPSYALPTLYAPWIAELLSGPIPHETKATCDDCAMCTKEGPVADRYSFDPHVKCCSYEPRLPNFMLGRILADDSSENAEARASVLTRIQEQLDVSPLGLVGSARYGLLYQHHDGFGRAPDLRCPHFVDAEDGGHCGIWANRPVVCATWFCKHDRGAVGQEFWSRLSALLRAIEMELSIWCAAELGAVSAELFTLERSPSARVDLAELGGPVDTERHRRIWGDWTGKELRYYQACAELVSEIRWEQVSAICGARTRMLVSLVQEAYNSLISEDIPVRLKVGAFRVEGVQNRKLRVVTYSGYDPLMMSEKLASALPYFSGQPWTDALESIRTSLGLRMDPQLVRRLTDFQFLVECKDPDGR
jgi:hypothetical protein